MRYNRSTEDGAPGKKDQGLSMMRNQSRKASTTPCHILALVATALVVAAVCIVQKKQLLLHPSRLATIPSEVTEGSGGSQTTGRDSITVEENGWKSIDVFYGKEDHLEVGIYKKVPDGQEQWYSQQGQDEAVWNLLGQLEGGYFVDLASNDATYISNTYGLETNHGWNGLCLEANPKYWARLAYRKCTVVGAIVGSKRMEEVTFNFGTEDSMQVTIQAPKGIESGMLGGIIGFDNKQNDKVVSAKRYTVPLSEIFQRHNVPPVIDYFSFDVEGAESFVMAAFPFDQYTFRVLTVERPKPDLKALLQSKGYEFIKMMSSWGEELWHHPAYTGTNRSITEQLEGS